MSDSHLSPRAPYADDNWSAVVDHVAGTGADLVVHTGDITFDGARYDEELIHARAQLDRLPAPWVAVPGNHDIGDELDPATPLTAERRSRYEQLFGATSWVRELHGWRLVGLDIQTLMADGDEAAGLAEWLRDCLSRDAPIALFLHRPLWPWSRGEDDATARYVHGDARVLIDELLGGGSVRLVASGHLHQWRQATFDGVHHVWCPSTWAMLPDRIQPHIGEKVVGIAEFELDDQGGVTSHLVRPVGIAQVTGGEDFAVPYQDPQRS